MLKGLTDCRRIGENYADSMDELLKKLADIQKKYGDERMILLRE